MRLYICGNGFDRHHLLPTGYEHYRGFLQKHHPGLLREYDGFPYLTETKDLDRWADVEAALCIDYEELFYQSVQANYPDVSSDSDSRWSEIDIDIDVLTRFINDFTGRCFFEWISKAERCDAVADLTLDKESLFINFNYTNTLQRLYGIPESSILHIHGALKNLDVRDILGQDILPSFSTIEEAEILEPLAEADKWSNGYIRNEIQFGATGITAERVELDLSRQYGDDDFYAVSIEPAIGKLVDFVDKSTKHPEENYDRLIAFIEGKGIEEVIVMGVSLGDADDAYYSDILVPRLKKAKWTFMLYGDDSSRIDNFIHRHQLTNTDIQKW